MKALSLWQPWATFVALGVKTIETRSWSTSYRGPLAIHATKRAPDVDRLGPWNVFAPNENDGWRITRTDPNYRRGSDRSLITHQLPRGVVVATCTLVDIVPMLAMSDPSPLFGGWVRLGESQLGLNRGDDKGMEFITEQRPFGDFAPGRYAWILDDIVALDPPVEASGRQGLWSWNI